MASKILVTALASSSLVVGWGLVRASQLESLAAFAILNICLVLLESVS